MKRFIFVAALVIPMLAMTSGCLPTQTIIVKFADLQSDIFALESTLGGGSGDGDWAKFDWNTMTITISQGSIPADARPVTLGAFQISQAATPPPSAAQNIDLKTIQTSETVIQVMRRRQERNSVINDALKRELAGEANNGLLKKPNSESGFDDFSFAFVADQPPGRPANDENTDRKILCQEIVRQRGYRFEEVAREFAHVRRVVIPAGVWMQSDLAVWSKKP